jgi:hypothetical protein
MRVLQAPRQLLSLLSLLLLLLLLGPTYQQLQQQLQVASQQAHQQGFLQPRLLGVPWPMRPCLQVQHPHPWLLHRATGRSHILPY